MKYERLARLDSRIDTDSGEFDMTLASEGEASDGHILNVRGIEFPDRLPLQVDHARSVVANLGNVTNIRTEKRDGVAVVRGVGQIRLTGDGEALAARRDLVDGIASGDISGVSLTWDSVEHAERRLLPKSHPAAVSKDEPDARKRFGLYFQKSRAIEQSIVAIPADRRAVIGRAEAAPDDLSRAMWHSLCERLDDAPKSREGEIIDALEREIASLGKRIREFEALTSKGDVPPAETRSPLEVFLQTARDEQAHSARFGEDLRDTLAEVFGDVTGKSLYE